MGLCDGRTVIITGAARGLGRAYALAFAAEGANVVVNDIGTSLRRRARYQCGRRVVAEIKAAGGKALANYEDITDWDAAKRIVDAAVAEFGDLHVVVNNAGIVRDRMFVSATLEEWDATMHVHLRGHFCLSRHAVDYWRGKQKAGTNPDARIINTSSGAGFRARLRRRPIRQPKGGIASLTLVQAAELGRYGITANALAPSARTRMTEQAFAEKMATEGQSLRRDGPGQHRADRRVAGIGGIAHVTGCVFELEGGKIMLEDGWREGPVVDARRALGPGGCWRCGGQAARRARSAAQSVGDRLMEFSFTEEQEDDRGDGQGLLRENATSERTRKAMANDGIDRELWRTSAPNSASPASACPKRWAARGWAWWNLPSLPKRLARRWRRSRCSAWPRPRARLRRAAAMRTEGGVAASADLRRSDRRLRRRADAGFEDGGRLTGVIDPVPHGAVADVFVFVSPGKGAGSCAPMRRGSASRAHHDGPDTALRTVTLDKALPNRWPMPARRLPPSIRAAGYALPPKHWAARRKRLTARSPMPRNACSSAARSARSRPTSTGWPT
jgi:NAD(P)-dependent dehydrogenase (short-subunit alcohol dehydrogenase family)